MKISFILTNYNNSLLSIQAIESILEIKGLNEFLIIVVDNDSKPAEKEKLKIFLKNKNINELYIFFSNENVGYFKGLNLGIEMLLKKIKFDADYVFIGNNDLIFPEDITHILSNRKKILNKYPVISPDLITLNGIHQNPHIINKISNFRKHIYSIYFSNYYISLVIFFISVVTKKISKRKDSNHFKNAQTIQQGYGACYILTKLFFKHFEKLDAPVFLMGEEYFLSNQIHSKKMEIFYEPSIKIKHADHATLGKLYSKKIWSYTRDSYKLYKKLFLQ